jgi:hypothetical protein
MFYRILSSAEREEMEKERREKLAKFARIVSGEDRSSSINNKNIAPVLPMNRYRFGFGSSKIRAGSHLPTPNNRIVLHPESMEKPRKHFTGL